MEKLNTRNCAILLSRDSNLIDITGLGKVIINISSKKNKIKTNAEIFWAPTIQFSAIRIRMRSLFIYRYSYEETKYRLQ